jgi:hypothetical protein
MNADMAQVLPTELSYPELQTLPYMKRMQMTLIPDGTSVFTAQGQVCRCVLPTFRGWDEFSQSCLSARLTVAGGADAAGAFDAPTEAYALTPNGYGAFDSLAVSIGGSQVENISQPALIFQALTEACSSTCELHSKSLPWGTDREASGGLTTGHLFNVVDEAGYSKTMNISLPLVGFLAELGSAISATSEIEISLTIVDIIKRVCRLGATSPLTFVLDKLVFQYDLLETSDLSYWNQVTSVPLSLKTSTWLYSSSQINANTQGSIDLNVLARAQS